jgi:hypothetical protein
MQNDRRPIVIAVAYQPRHSLPSKKTAHIKQNIANPFEIHRPALV